MGRGLDRAGLDRWLDVLDERQREYLGLSATATGGSTWAEGLHPDDQAGLDAAWRAAARAGEPWTAEGRWRHADGEYRWSLLRAVPVRDESGAIARWYGVKTDVDDLKRKEESLRQDALELRLFVDFVPQNIAVLAPEGRIVRINRSGLEYLGLTLEQVVQADNLRSTIYHPDDLAVLGPVHRDGFSRGFAFEIEARIRRHDGQFRWFLLRYEPFRDTDGRIMRWYLAGTDIEERKRVEDRMREENIALREEIDQASMFEQIVGASTPLRSLLSHVVKVAPTESTVLITGETGTGKELVARAIHKRSRRAQRVFVSVNCAAIPPALIASELFGHEKGAFTGAVQRRTGRFELAEGGTLFLDEVGDLPAETQTTLLRVLQEREFERVGGSRPIPTDVRVIAATNRNLKAAIADGTFRSDLYYRLNVFPVALPSLRERKDDIPLLVQYFVDRYSRNAGARIRAVSKRSLALLQSYPWPGNIRELQNVIERAVIICDTDTLQVDESWLLGESRDVNRFEQSLVDHLGGEERAAIEAALTETRGKVSGPSGAAAKLRMPSTTLESRIKSLGIDKSRFKRVY